MSGNIVQLRKKYYNLSRPYEPLDPGDERNVDLDSLGSPEQRVRGVNWVSQLAQRVEMSDKPVHVLLTGLPGSGKSTELRRLAQRLSQPAGANLLPVLIDADEALDLTSRIDIPDIIFTILHYTDEALLKAEGRSPSAAMGESPLVRFWNWLSKTDLELSKAELAAPDVGKLTVEMKTRPSLREQVRKAVGTHLTRFLREASEELDAMNGRALKLGRAGLVVILDSLEKLRGMSSSWKEVLDSAERVFARGAPYLRLPVHVFYTIPSGLADRDVLFFPMLKLHSPDGERFEPGFQAARELITRRIPMADLSQMLGPVVEQRLERLIRWSGGYPRELIRLLQNALLVEQWPLPESDFNRVLNEIGDQYRRTLSADTFPWLARVAVDHDVTIDRDDKRLEAARMLASNTVLCYRNEREWFDLHPAVKEIPGVAEEIRKLLEQRAKNASGNP